MATYEEYNQYAKIKKENLSLKKKITFSITCNSCDYEEEIEADNVAEARILYTEQGWVEFINDNLCPECKEMILKKIYQR